MKTINNILTWLQYGAAAGLIVIGILWGNNPLIPIGFSMLVTTFLYHMEKRKREELQTILRQLPSDKLVAREAAKKASEFKNLSPYEKIIMEHGFIAGTEFIYKNLNTK